MTMVVCLSVALGRFGSVGRWIGGGGGGGGGREVGGQWLLHSSWARKLFVSC